MAHLNRLFRPLPRYGLGGQVMSLLGTVMLVILATFTVSATYFVWRTEGTSWQGRQGEAARNAAVAVAAVLQRAQDTLAIVGIINADLLKSHREELVRLLEQNPTLEEVIRLDANGRVFVDAHRSRSVLAELITIPQARWFLDARSGRPYLGPVQLSFDSQPYLVMAIPSPDGGVVAARVRMHVLWNAVADIRFGETGRAYVVTRDGEIVAHTHPEVVLAQLNIRERPEFAALLAAPDSEWHGAYSNFEGLSVVGVTAPVPNTHWVVLAELPQTEAFAASRTALIVLGGGLLSLMAMTIWITARFVERLIVQPMEQLREGATRIGKGDLNYRIGLARGDEIGQLARAFDDMARSLFERGAQVTAQTAALQISEARYRGIVEDQTELICRFLPDGTLTFVNEAYCRYFRQAREALIGHSFVPLVHAEDHPLVEAHMARLGVETPLAVIEHRVILPGGAVRWQRWTDRVILDDQGRVIELQAVGQDITEHRLATLALQASEERLRRITDNMLDVISQIDVEGVIRYASPSHKWVLGLEADSVLGQLVFERLHPDDLTPALMAFGQALTDNSASTTVVFRYQHVDGHYVWMECVGNLLYDSQGQPAGAVLCSRDITARKQMEAALRESERRYRLLADNATDVIWVQDMNLHLTYISPSVTRLRGYAVEEALSQSLADILTPASAAHAERFFTVILKLAARATPESLRSQFRSLELEMSCKDGSTVWTESRMSFLLDEQGRPSAILGVTRDITERRRTADELRRLNAELEKRVEERTAELVQVNAALMAEVDERQRAEAALRESETRLRRIADNMLDLIVQVDVSGVYEYISPSHKAGMGYETEDLVGKPMYEFIHPDDLAAAMEAAQHAVATGSMSRLEVRCRHADGHYVWLESAGNPLLDEEGRVAGAIIGSRDITKRKQAEDSLRQAEARYRALVENLPAVVYVDVLDSAEPVGYRTLYISPQVTTLLGYTPEEVIGAVWPTLVHPDDREQEVAMDKQHFRTGAPLAQEYRMLRRDGRVVWVRDEAVALQHFEGQGRYSQGVLLDITERKRAEERLQASLREKEVLLKEVHHRVKNNLQIISSLLNLQSQSVDDSRVLQLLRDSQNRVKSMALVHEKLYGSADMSRIDFAEYVRSLTAQLFRTYSNASGAVALRLSVDKVWLNVDSAIPCGLIINELVSNSLKHAFPNGQEGTISVDVCDGGGGQIVLRVSDTGIGFPATLDFRNSPSLGLKLVNSLVDQINGLVELGRNGGTEFRINFNLSALAAGS